jgi:hypothetical protein
VQQKSPRPEPNNPPEDLSLTSEAGSGSINELGNVLGFSEFRGAIPAGASAPY